ncbi:MAG: ATP synthase F0 subunit B [bacterium]|nr:ATP synthase F0 subunit B [bacterium]
MEIFAKLGIDWHSIIVYVVNFGLLAVILAYFFTGPVLKMLDERRKTITDNLAQAEKIKNEFLAEKKNADEEKEKLRADMESQMSDLQKEMEIRRKEQEESLELKKTRMIEEVRSIVDEEKRGILKSAEKQTIELIEKVVLHVVSNNIPQDVVKNSVADAWKTYKS